MKILYSAGNRLGSYYQLKRFLESIKNKNHIVKIAAFKKSLCNLNADYMLDSLLNFTNPGGPVSFNGNYSYYRNEIKRFNPDLIISDYEIYTSMLATELKIKLWQYSPINIYHALDKKTKQNIGIHKNYSHLIESNHKKSEYVDYVMSYSSRKFALSHLCDCDNRPELIGFEWARPSFILGEDVDVCKYVIALAASNKKIIDEFKNKDAILLTPYALEKYDTMKVADIDSDHYKNALLNCKACINDGTAAFLADSFYNEKYSFSIPRYDDIEPIICSYMNEYCGVGRINFGTPQKVDVKINESVKFISEYLDNP